MEQRTEEWYGARLGAVGASQFERIMTAYNKRWDCGVEAHSHRSQDVAIKCVEKQKTPSIAHPIPRVEITDTVTKLAAKIAAERLTGEAGHNYQSADMLHGIATEPEAINAYEWETGNTVTSAGFITLDDTAYIGCSPDGLVGEDGGVEVKCPIPSTHIGWFVSGDTLPSEHRAQVQGSMWVTGRKWWGFISYTKVFRPVIIHVERDEDYISELADTIRAFDALVTEYTNQYRIEKDD